MRICVTGLRGIPDIAGGVETHCEHLMPRVAEILDTCDITVFTRSCYAAGSEKRLHRLRLVPIWTVRNKHAEAVLHTLLCVAYAKFRARADVMHIHAIGPALLTPLARALGMKVVVTHHGADYRRAKWGWLARWALRAGEQLAVAGADRVIAVSPSSAEDLRQRFPRRAETIRHIPNGALLPERGGSGSDVIARLGLLGASFVLAAGRLVPEKGFDDLIQAVRMRDDGVRLVIAGGVDHSDAYSRKLLAQADERIAFAGALPRAELADLLKACSLFVMPSHHEGLPIAALEALLAGAPCLLSDIRANRDLGLPSECYFPTGSATDLAVKLRQPHERFRAPAGCVAPFDWSRIAVETAEVYRELDPSVRPSRRRALKRRAGRGLGMRASRGRRSEEEFAP